VNRNYISSEEIADYVIESWTRCIEKNVPRKLIIDNISYKQINNYSFNKYLFTELAVEINSIIRDELVFFLINKNCVLLDLVCKDTIRKEIMEVGIRKGFSFLEQDIGTNAVSLACELKQAVYLQPKYHYCNFFKDWCSFSIPLKKNNHIEGYLSIVKINQNLPQNIIAISKLLAYIITTRNKKCQTHKQKKLYNLSDRQLQVLRLIASGMTEKAVARQLQVSQSTVKYHKQILFKKLKVQSIVEAVVRSLKLGLISVDELHLKL